ncbi:hypothetical protein APHAL10511_002797 [Amanita phalloides]|nr:hypothetical protein APHAL10511_002797 [Amanita phalloides]
MEPVEEIEEVEEGIAAARLDTANETRIEEEVSKVEKEASGDKGDEIEEEDVGVGKEQGNVFNEDVNMGSPPPLKGSSHMSGAIIRGRALGNIFNNADVEEPPLPLGQKGVVKLFTSLAQAEGPTKPLILKTKVVPTIAPVLKRLAELSPFIKDDNHHVTLLDGDQWSMMGTYRLAVGENEEIEWSLESGIPSLTLCISATNPLTAVTSGGGSTAPAPAPESTGFNSAQHSKKELITLLNIPEHLTIDIKGKILGFREYYSRYRACLEAQSTLSEKIQAGTWVGKRPNNATIIQLFY